MNTATIASEFTHRVQAPRRLFEILALCLALSAPALATDRALLVGIDQYADPSIHLAGIDHDLQAMTLVAGMLGFDEQRQLRGSKASYQGVKRALCEFLIDGTTPDDRVLIYVSSHGIRLHDDSGDERVDGLDEALALHDFAVVHDAHGRHPRGVLVDDELLSLLARIPARSVLLIVDACHSGTVHKRLEQHALQPKFLPDMDGLLAPLLDWFDRDAQHPGLVVITAAADGQQAYSSEQGSVFTLGLARTVIDAQRSEQRPNARDLWDGSLDYASDRLGAGRPARPQIGGSWAAQRQRWALSPVDGGLADAVYRRAEAFQTSAEPR